MTIYLAGPWIERKAVKTVANLFQERGFSLTSAWYDSQEDTLQEGDFQIQADKDCRQLLAANVFVVLNWGVSEGKATELGLALAWDKPCIVLGPRNSSNIFHYLPEVFHAPTFEMAVKELTRLQASPPLH